MDDEREPPDFPAPLEPRPSREAASELEPTQTFFNLAQHLKPGKVIAERYRIVKLLGFGGMGYVYQAWDQELDQTVALKILRPELLQDEASTERFKRELILARKVSHRNVVRIHDIGEYQGLRYLSMSFVEGQSLKELLKSKGHLEPAAALEIFSQICEAMQVAHEEGVIHRDLKPANVLLDTEGRIFLTDFGIASSADTSGLTHTGAIVGTPAYLSPEQLRGEPPEKWSDIYALGLLLYEMLTGELPPADARQRRERLKARESPLPAPLVAVIDRCLAVEPRHRYASPAGILADLERRQASPFPSWTAWKVSAAVLILLLVVIAGYYFQRTPSGPDPSQREVLVVLPFQNNLQNPELDWMRTAVCDVVISDLSRSRGLRVVGMERVLQTLSDLKIEGYSFDAPTLKRLADIFGSDYLVHGSLTPAGSSLRIDSQLVDPVNPDQPVFLSAAGEIGSFLDIVSDLGDQLRLQLHSRDASQRRSLATTQSQPALEAYHKGARFFREGRLLEAATHFEQATEEDPRFVAAYLMLSRSYEDSGEVAQARVVLRKALDQVGEDTGPGSQLVAARLALLNDDLERALQTYRRVIESSAEDADLHFEFALALEYAGQLKEALQVLERVIEIDPGHPRAYFQLGKDTILLGDSDRAISQYLVKGLAVATQLGNEASQSDILNAIGVAYERLGRYDDAIRYYLDSIVLKEKTGNQRGAGTSYSNIAKIQIFRGQYQEAEQNLEKARNLFETVNYLRGVSDVMNLVGVLNEDKGEFEKAVDSYRQALQVRKTLGDDGLVAQSYDNIGYIYYLTGRYDDAQVFWQQALDLKQTVGDQRGIVLSRQNMGFLQIAQGNLDQATRSFLESLNEARSIQLENAIAVALGNLGSIYQKQGRYRAAMESYNEAIELLQSLGDRKGQAEYERLAGAALHEVGAFTEAATRLDRALEMALEIENNEIAAQARLEQSRLARLQENLEEAEVQLERARELGSKLEKISIEIGIEQGLLDIRRKNFAAAENRLDQCRRQAQGIGNFWLTLASEYALAELLLGSDRSRQALDLLESLRAKTEARDLRPLLLRIYGLLGRAWRMEKQLDRSEDSFRTARSLLEEMTSQIEEKHRSNLGRIPEIALLLQPAG